MQYEVVAEAYRDLEQASARLVLIDRLAALLAQTPAEELPTVCYLCQGLIAPQFAGVDLGLAEKLAVRAVATATGASPEQVRLGVREMGDLGQAAEQLLSVTAEQAVDLPGLGKHVSQGVGHEVRHGDHYSAHLDGRLAPGRQHRDP